MKNDKNNMTKNNKMNGKNFFAKNRIIIGIVMLVFSLITGLIILPKAVAVSGSSTVYTVKDTVKEGTVITMDILDKTKTSDKVIAAFAYSNEQEIITGNLIARYDIPAGAYLTKANATNGNAGLGDVVPADKEILSVPVESIHSTVSYALRSGDIIRFYHAFENELKLLEVVIPSSLQYVKVFDVYDSDGVSCSLSGATPKSISLVVTKEQALEIVTIINADKSYAYYSLMTSGDAEKADKFLDQQESILKKLEGGEDVEDIIIDNSDINSGELEFNGELVKPDENTEGTFSPDEGIEETTQTEIEEETSEE